MINFFYLKAQKPGLQFLSLQQSWAFVLDLLLCLWNWGMRTSATWIDPRLRLQGNLPGRELAINYSDSILEDFEVNIKTVIIQLGDNTFWLSK